MVSGNERLYIDNDFSCRILRLRPSQGFSQFYKVGNVVSKAYTGKSKINSATKLPPVGIEPRTFLVFCFTLCA